MHNDSYTVYCEEGEALYEVSYNLQDNEVAVIALAKPQIRKEYFEKVQNEGDKSLATTITCAKSEAHALEKAARVFRDYFEKMAQNVSKAIDDELDSRENWWCAKFIPVAKILKLTCIREIPVGYSHNLVFVGEEGGCPKFFTFVEAKEYDAAWEKAFRLFRDYINDCNDTLDYIDTKNCTRASRKE